MRIISILLILFACIILFFGFMLSSSAIQESVVVGIACFLAILSRLAQAEYHHREFKNK